MNPFLEKMLSQVYELEGLLLVIERHKGDTSEFIYEMVRRKVERINELAPMCVPDIFGPKDSLENVEEVETMPEQKDSEAELDIEEPTLAVEEPITDDEPIEDEEEPDAFEEPKDDDAESFGVEEEFEAEDAYEEADETEYNDEEDVDSLDGDSVNEYDDLSKDEYDDCLIDEVDEVLTVDEALQRSLSKNLWKAFSLNDHFRYRRELFSNSDVEMRNTINMVEAMQSFAEAEEYFYNDLEWDAESPEVKDFMEIIRKHFL